LQAKIASSNIITTCNHLNCKQKGPHKKTNWQAIQLHGQLIPCKK